MQDYKGFKVYSDKLKFALQAKLDRIGTFIFDSQTLSSVCVDTLGVEYGWMEDSIVANKLGLLMWSTDKLHKDRLLDHSSTMEQRPNADPVLVAK
ncbi:MAG: hypothetical protein ACKPKO_50940, partial [Candidatus Fonsibacter sp.]